MNGPTVRLSGLCDLIAEPVRPGTGPETLYLSLEHLASGRLARIGGGQASNVRSTTSAFQTGDVLYGKLRPYLDKAVLADMAGVCTTELLVLRARERVDPRFLTVLLHSPHFVDHAVAGTTGVQHPRTSWAHIRDFEVPVLSFEEQRQTADVFWLVNEAIHYSETLIDMGQHLKRAAMQKLFTHGLRGDAQKETEIGPVPRGWQMTPCEEIFKLTSGRKRPTNLADQPRDDRVCSVLGGNGVMGYAADWLLDASQVLVIGRVGEYCGVVHIASGKVWITDNALYTNEWLNDDAELRFVAAFLEYFDLNRFKRMAGQPLITQGMIYEHNIPLPSISEQREIIDTLNAFDLSIDLHRRKRAALGDLFTALLFKLLTREINIKDFNL